ncbi:MAG: uncharacterized protein QOE33_1751 [Acidobacteriota bacterium]|nr:uncharacterized protein [Acidobacteriota bacterium]
MINIEDVPRAEMEALLRRVGFGHLGSVDAQGRPYVVPMHFAFDGEVVYLFTTEGTKTENIEHHPQVCLQVEEIEDATRWQSVMIFGKAEHLTRAEDLEHAMQSITLADPTLTPAVNRTQIDSWGRASNVAVYRIRPEAMDGRRTIPSDATR